jgi:hypothetical protein
VALIDLNHRYFSTYHVGQTTVAVTSEFVHAVGEMLTLKLLGSGHCSIVAVISVVFQALSLIYDVIVDQADTVCVSIFVQVCQFRLIYLVGSHDVVSFQVIVTTTDSDTQVAGTPIKCHVGFVLSNL